MSNSALGFTVLVMFFVCLLLFAGLVAARATYNRRKRRSQLQLIRTADNFNYMVPSYERWPRRRIRSEPLSEMDRIASGAAEVADYSPGIVGCSQFQGSETNANWDGGVWPQPTESAIQDAPALDCSPDVDAGGCDVSVD